MKAFITFSRKIGPKMNFFCFSGLMNLLLVENQSAQEFRVKGGSQRISQKLVSKIGPHRVLLKHAATKIEQTVVLVQDPIFRALT